MRRCPRRDLARHAARALLLSVSLGALAGATEPTLTLPRLFSCFGPDLTRLDAAIQQRYDAVIWHNHPKRVRALSALKQRNPRVTGFMYRELFCVLKEETPLGESVGRYDWIEAHHPEWFQRDTEGRRVEIPDYPGRWMMDLGHPGWQEFWITQTLRDVVDGGWDGVFADDALTSGRAHALPSLAGYPDDAALQEAVGRFLARATGAFHAASKLLVANVSNSYDYPGLWDQWLDATDGLMEEHFAGVGWTWGEHVAARQLEAMAASARRGKWMFCFTEGAWDDHPRLRTSLAAYLIGAGPKTYWSYRPGSHADRGVWDPAGGPSPDGPGEPARLEGTVWRRQFRQVLVLLNAGSDPQRIETPCGAVELAPREGRLVETTCDTSLTP